MIVIGRWNLTRKPTIQKPCTVLYCSKEPRGSLIVRNMLGLCDLLKTEVAGKLRCGGGATLHHGAQSFTFTFCTVTLRQDKRFLQLTSENRYDVNETVVTVDFASV